jgi:hypothetical protein
MNGDNMDRVRRKLVYISGSRKGIKTKSMNLKYIPRTIIL